jgi:hypothetical protein
MRLSGNRNSPQSTKTPCGSDTSGLFTDDADTSTAGSLTVTPPKLERVSQLMRQTLKSGPVEFRRAYMRMFVHRVVVSRREVRISGPKSALAGVASSDLPAPGPGVLIPGILSIDRCPRSAGDGFYAIRITDEKVPSL